jgi:small subunit ribosomal protein S6
MRRYETFVIVDPDISEEQRTPVIERTTDLITKENGLTVKVDEWGMRKLAYEIKKKPRGYYLRLDFCGTGAIVDEMERFFRIDDRVMKYMTVLLEKDVDVKQIKEDLAKAAAEKEAAAAEKEAAAAEKEAAAAAAAAEKVKEEKAPEMETDADGPETEAVEPDSAAKPETETVKPETADTEPKGEDT